MKTPIMIFYMAISVSCILLMPGQLKAQNLEVEGKAKITVMDQINTASNVVVRLADGTLGSRSVSSLPPPPPPIDTTRNLASDFELAKHLCQCGANIPPFLAESLLASGYTQEDLLSAGVPFSVLPFTCGDTIIDDRDGKSYSTKLIGSQCWMTENLNVGSMISGTTDMTNNFVLEKYCYDDDLGNCTIYGGLYQWNEMMQYKIPSEVNQGICPTNWHLPTDTEWKTLEIELGMTQAQADDSNYRGTDQGSQLAGNEALWTDGLLDQNGAFGSSGFMALPGGLRDGTFGNVGYFGLWWSSTESNTDVAWYRSLFYNNDGSVGRVNFNKGLDLSVRCLRD